MEYIISYIIYHIISYLVKESFFKHSICKYKAYACIIVGQVDWRVSVCLELVMVLHSCLYNEFIRIVPVMWYKHG